MTLIKSVYDVLEDKEITKVNVEFAIGQGYYINIRMDEKLTREMVEKIRQRMKELVDADRPITKRSYPVDDAVELFRKYKMFDKVNLFRYRRGSSVNIYCLTVIMTIITDICCQAPDISNITMSCSMRKVCYC